ncbi:acetyl-CoA carboxylase biotin carboxylase subunit [Alkalimarinus alittae]|uniref:Acetyl/propionyl/methylcrotonyl-CoA carboxylase subunit alpha n=1 Tax=Alkalimarinus alittae TaxID=2961619 RepID=A0ABY6MXD8_9ALTE|nr:acetyl/propionyl/methylcrotonyl-CoA carboxylase subunit alpha [Alkalimarinus alittae]UZE94465.1 acetyl/propionyl/methylcrotonyl-CoA carboxylase subunit alpha [Alkalimarinus alittae]
MFTKILIANRGEIACRIIKTAKAMGIKTVAVYSDADRQALFVDMADEAYYLGGAEPAQSYLKLASIIEIAKTAGAQAIHPGYGFLSENPNLPKQCQQNNIVFIGPPAESIEAMGSKSQAKLIMSKAGVPLVPGYHGDDQSIEILTEESLTIGFPQLIKASAGGGGKGMRIVRSIQQVESSIRAAKREALSSFGDEKLLIEKYIEQPRHIEVQIFCDENNNGVYLYDRDCSIQRRHQKIIEEAPAPGLSPETRAAMGKAALDCAQAINYVGAGTVEFLLDKDEQFYFMEMNTRLQVEHPVTEMITQVDLVEWQFRIANGEPLPLSQQEIPCVGHAFESRIYAESPAHDFLPATGTIRYLSQPKPNDNIRIDTGIRQNDTISVFYDPMIAKLITWGDNRKIAARKMNQALNSFHISGVETNCDFLKSVITHPSFLKKDITTEFIEQHSTTLFASPIVKTTDLLMAATLYIHLITNRAPLRQNNQSHIASPWDNTDLWHLNGSQTSTFTLVSADQPFIFNVSKGRYEQLSINYEGQTYEIAYSVDANKITTRINGTKSSNQFYISEDSIHLFTEGCSLQFSLPVSNYQYEEPQPEGSLFAPIHGKIVSVEVDTGQHVEKGDALIIIEAMKMEHTISAPDAGIIKEVFCKTQDLVDAENQLIEFEVLKTSSKDSQKNV